MSMIRIIVLSVSVSFYSLLFIIKVCEMTAKSEFKTSKSVSSINSMLGVGFETMKRSQVGDTKIQSLLSQAQTTYNSGHYKEALSYCERAYEIDAFRTDNLLLLGSVHFQMQNYSEAIFYNQQCIRVDPTFAEAYSNLGSALKELGDIHAAIQFYLKAIKLKPRFGDAYNNLASAYMQLGQMHEAMETFKMSIILNPSLVDAHSNMGNLHKLTGNFEESKRCYLEAIRIKPDFAIAWSNLAGLFKEEGELKISVAYYREALRLCPEFPDAHSNLGNALKESGLVEEAVLSYQMAIKLRPDFAIAHSNLGSCHFDRGDYEAALRCFKYAIQLQPNLPDAYNNLGNTLQKLGHYDESIQSFRAALRLKPDHPHAYNNLGNAMRNRGCVQEAIHCYITAIRLMPRFPVAHNNVGSILKEQGKFDQALAHYKEAISLDPRFADALCNMGNVYKALRRQNEAIECYERSIEINPNFAEAYCNLGRVLQAQGDVTSATAHFKRALEIKPNFAEALSDLVFARMRLCNWSDEGWAEDQARVVRMVQAHLRVEDTEGRLLAPCVQPFQSIFHQLSLQEMQQLASQCSLRTRLNSSLVDRVQYMFPKRSHARIKIGYVSSDFGNHPIGHLMQSVFELHDRNKFEVICYSLSPTDNSSWRAKIQSSADEFRDVSEMHFGHIASLIRTDKVHILVNLNGYTGSCNNEIFSLHPCPVQISMMGFCGTMAADFMDYLVADSVVVPPEMRPYYTEKIICMPHAYCVNDLKQSAAFIINDSKPATRSQYGLSEDKFVFCNFCEAFTITPEMFLTWMKILQRVPNAVLWLMSESSLQSENLLAEAKRQGVSADQIVFCGVVAKEEHIRRGVLADLCLDSSINTSCTAACDLLWGATPVLSLAGDKMASRITSSMLRAVGLSELACASLTQYEELAVALAEDTDRLYNMRRHLENCRETCPAFDTARWVHNFERGVETVWQLRDKGSNAEDITVSDVANFTA